MDFSPSDKSIEYLHRLKDFMQKYVYPFEEEYRNFHHKNHSHPDWKKWKEHPKVVQLKLLAKKEGLWNLFLPDAQYGAGLTTLEYSPLAEEMGKVYNSAEIFNCNAPDTGNMEVLYHFGTTEQKKQWLLPLLESKIKSVFCMTEPDVASSDATNIQTSIEPEGDEIVINGTKWWVTGLGHPEAKLAIVMGKTKGTDDRHKQHSMVLVPLETKGIEIKRMLSTLGAFDAPAGHGEVTFKNVRVPKEHILVTYGAGFSIAQGRLGPGRIHHCMRCIGAAERALGLMLERGNSREAFGKKINQLGGTMEKIAEARIEIEQARLLTYHAAWKIDHYGIKASMAEISAIKVVAPRLLQKITDMAMQVHGGAGLSEDFPLSSFFIQARALRLADGPDEVHKGVISKIELRKYQ